MIVFDHLSTLSKRGSGQRLHGLSGVGIVLGGLWVVLKLEWSPRTPPVESCRDRSSFHQPHHHLVLFLSLYSSPISIFPFFFCLCSSFFQPHLQLSLLFGFCSSFSLGFGGGCLTCFSSVFRVFCELRILLCRVVI